VGDFDKTRIDALLADLRAHDPEDGPVSSGDLARKHRLDPMIVRRLAESEGLTVVDDGAPESEIDDMISTGPIDVTEP
jgi:hypothetical protein